MALLTFNISIATSPVTEDLNDAAGGLPDFSGCVALAKRLLW
jgi:hypothetical protein